MPTPEPHFAQSLFRWVYRRSGGVLHLVLVGMLLLASSGSIALLRANAESEYATDFEEEEASTHLTAGTSWARGSSRPGEGTIAVMARLNTRNVALKLPSSVTPHFSHTGHFLPNGLRAPMRC